MTTDLSNLTAKEAAAQLAASYRAKRADFGQMMQAASPYLHNPLVAGTLGGAGVGALAGAASPGEGGIRGRLRRAFTGAGAGAVGGLGAGAAYRAITDRGVTNRVLGDAPMPRFQGPDGKEYQFDAKRVAANPDLAKEIADASETTWPMRAVKGVGYGLGTATAIAPFSTVGLPAVAGLDLASRSQELKVRPEMVDPKLHPHFAAFRQALAEKLKVKKQVNPETGVTTFQDNPQSAAARELHGISGDEDLMNSIRSAQGRLRKGVSIPAHAAQAGDVRSLWGGHLDDFFKGEHAAGRYHAPSADVGRGLLNRLTLGKAGPDQVLHRSGPWSGLRGGTRWGAYGLPVALDVGRLAGMAMLDEARQQRRVRELISQNAVPVRQ